jgi:predicted Zn-dependent protease
VTNALRHLAVGGFCVALAAAAGCRANVKDSARDHAARGDQFAADGRYDAALIEYRNAVKAQPAWSEAHEKVGDALLQLGRTTDAYREYARGLRVVNNELLPYEEDKLREAVTRSPQSVGPRLALAELLMAKRKAQEAEVQLRAAIAADPGNELANRSLASIALNRGDHEEAEARLRTAAAQTPQRYASQLALADFLMSEQRFVEARPILQALAADRRLSREVPLRLAAIDYEEGAVDAAQRALSEILRIHPSADAWTLEAQFRMRQGRLNEAADAVAAALALAPSHSPARSVAVEIRRKQLAQELTQPAVPTARHRSP